jgi:squalene-associated FAD-dependent desaturase
MRVAVVGGGLAGITAALDCAEAGAEVTLYERRSRLGGLTWSFEHGGRMVDNGQHVFLRCCTAYLDFLSRIGSAGDVVLQDRLDVPVVRPTGDGPVTARLRRVDLPAPLHLGPALLRYRHLTVADRLRLGGAVVALRRLDLGDPALDSETFGAWLARHGQSTAAMAALWDLITVPTVNLPAKEASLAMAAKVFQTGLLTDPKAADIGWSAVPLGVLHGRRAAAALETAGVEVCLSAPVTEISQGNGLGPRWSVRTQDTGNLSDAVVVAVPHQALAGLVPPGAWSGQSRLAALGQSAVLDVHLVYDRRVTEEPLVAGVDSAVQWVFDRTVSSGMDPSAGQYLAVSLSGADGLLGRHPDDLAATIERELPRLLPEAGAASVIDRLVTKERTATFRAVPGTAALRPPAQTRLPGLAVAGAWTDTGWPATMEGAVRSGHAAARAALSALSSLSAPARTRLKEAV